MDEPARFAAEVADNIKAMSHSQELRALTQSVLADMTRYKYSYNFRWLGRPIIQLPQDMLAMQEIIWRVQPDLIVETGIAHGGGLIYYASLLELNGGEGRVLGIDVDIRKHNRAAIETHPMFKRISMIEGSSTDEAVVEQVRSAARGKRELVALDSNHTHEHVLRELELYSPLIGEGSYFVVFDTAIEDIPADALAPRPWAKGNNPKTAVWEFLQTNDRFVVDESIESKLLITCAPGGYLKCIRDR